MKRTLLLLILCPVLTKAQIITTIAGNGIGGYNSDGIAATTAQLNYPDGVAVDGSGNVYIADCHNNRVRKVSSSTGIISTVAGTGIGLAISCGSGVTDGVPATTQNISGGPM
jgi:S-formylglutathione hydrolase FrmB